MKHLIIIGARGYGRDTYDIARDMHSCGVTFDIKGYLDDKSDALDNYPNYPPILDSVEHYAVQPDDVFVCALGDVHYKKKYVEIVLEKGGEFFNIIHPSAHIGNNLKIGQGCIIGYNAQIDCDVTLGNFVNIQTSAVIGHDSIVGDWSILDSFTFMGGGARLGESVTLHTSAIIVPHKEVGNNATINAGSVVIRNVKDGAIMMGNPAKELLVPNIK